MNPSTPSVEDILAEAVEVESPAERQVFVEKACAGDAALKQRVERLIANHFRAGSFLERPAVAVDYCATAGCEASPADEGPGMCIGPYKLLEQIGEGGMGLVYVAEQQRPVKRRVALKIIKPGMDSRQVVARFEAERQTLALMDHANIAKVHDGGATPEGRPYFVMELVQGTPITAYCDAQRHTTRQRLEIFLDVCRAVQHAHQKGIIHRDIKPSNVMVTVHDAAPVVKVIDFGIAKATGQHLTDKTVYTACGQMIGTPLYMSPEQAGLTGLDVDTRSDVYALGVLLYEVLTGTTPFDGETLKKADYDEMRRIIREEEPARPSARISTMQPAHLSAIAEQRGLEPRRLNQQLRGELDWIVMRALEKDRNRRYESASAFAADVQRYLNDEPVEACPASAWYLVKKFVRRHKVALATAAVMAASLLSATAFSAMQAAKADKARTLAEIGETTANLQRGRAEDNLRTSLGLVKTQQELLEIIKTTPQSGIDVEQLARWDGQLVEVLEKLRDDRLDDPDHLYRLAQAHEAWSDALAELGRLAEAETALRQSISLYTDVGSQFPKCRHRHVARSNVPQLHVNLAEVQRADGRLANAEESYREALRLFATPEWAKGPLGPEGFTLSGLARCLLAAGRIQEADALYRQSLQSSPDRMQVGVGWAWFLVTRPDEDRRNPGEAIKVAKKWYGDNIKYDVAGLVLGAAQYRAGDWQPAAATLGDAVKTREGRENGAGFFLAMARWQLRDKDKAREHFHEAVAWTDGHRPKDVELLRLRAEAAKLLEIRGD